MVKKNGRKKKSDASTREAAQVSSSIAPDHEAAAVSCSSDSVDIMMIPFTRTSCRLKLPHQPKQFARMKGSIRKLIGDKLSDQLSDMRSVISEMLSVTAEIKFIDSSKGAGARTAKATHRYLHWKRKQVLSYHFESLLKFLTQLGKLVLKVPRNLPGEIETGVYSLLLKHLDLERAFILSRQEHEKVERFKRELNEVRKAKAAGRGDTGIHCRFQAENRKAGNEGVSEEFGKSNSGLKPIPCLVEPSLIESCDEGGFYSVDALNPVDLVNAVTIVRNHMTSFSKCFWNALQAEESAASTAVLTSRYSGVQFIRKHHLVSYALKASLCKILYRGFQNEDFRSGIIRDLDPHKRRQAFTESFRQFKDRLLDGSSHDELFSTFRQMKLRRLTRKFHMRLGRDSLENVTTQILEDLGGPQLSSLFSNVIEGIWLLHKVAFAFLTPASILWFGSSSVVNLEYMDPVEEGNEGFVAVGFTVSPGFRLGQTVIKAEVYPG